MPGGLAGEPELRESSQEFGRHSGHPDHPRTFGKV